MKATKMMNAIAVPVSLLALGSVGLAEPPGTDSCHSIIVMGELSAGELFEKPINKNFILKFNPQRMGPNGDVNAWGVALVQADGRNRDYIYPVNPPLRFNPLQIIGPAYGEDTKTSLRYPHRMRFLLSKADYDRLWPLVENALWPYNAPDPDKAANQYVKALKSLSTGELNLKILHYQADRATGSIRHISFRAEINVPKSFGFDQVWISKAVSCDRR
jgi:hypothetical protein